MIKFILGIIVCGLIVTGFMFKDQLLEIIKKLWKRIFGG